MAPSEIAAVEKKKRLKKEERTDRKVLEEKEKRSQVRALNSTMTKRASNRDGSKEKKKTSIASSSADMAALKHLNSQALLLLSQADDLQA